jgi:hypothetical protein
MAQFTVGTYVQIAAKGKEIDGRFGVIASIDSSGKPKVRLFNGNACTAEDGARMSIDSKYLNAAPACCICGLLYTKETIATCPMCEVCACFGCVLGLDQQADSWKCVKHVDAEVIPPAPTAPLPPRWATKFSKRKRTWYNSHLFVANTSITW